MVLIVNRGISPQGNTLYFTDASTWGTGSEARVSNALVGFVTYKKSSADEVILPAAYLAETVTTFSFDVTNKDGVYIAKFFALPFYTNQVLTEGDIVFDITDRLVKKYISGVLVVIPVTQLATETISISTTKYALVSTQISISRDNLELIKLQKQKDVDMQCCEYQDFLKAQNNYNYVRSLRNGACIDFGRANYLNAQLKIETGLDFATKALAE